MLDFIAIGDSTLDVFLQISEATISCQINKEQCLLCMQYAEKIPVESVVQIPGAGNASNAAVGAARLGLRSGIVSILGKDDLGKVIIVGWKKEKVDTRLVTFDTKHGTNYSTVLNFKGERTILVHGERRNYHLPNIDGTKWVYYTSLGPGHEVLERELLVHLKKRHQQKLCFNPGTAQLRRGLKSIRPILGRSNVFIVNKQEAELLLSDGERPTQTLLIALKQFCPGIVIITDGPKGSYATDGKTIWSMDIFPGPMVERTGAGDAYATGVCCALFMGLSIPEALRVGTAEGWSVVQHIGPQKGLLTHPKLRAVLKKFSKVKATSTKVLIS